MYANTTLLQTTLAQAGGEFTSRQSAVEAFWKAYGRGRWQRFWAALTGRSTALASLNTAAQAAPLHARRYAGIRLEEITEIVGSEGRQADFDASFHPLQAHSLDRWVSVATARRRGLNLPPVTLIQAGGQYYVRDGHHRISVAKARGERLIEAEVLVWGQA